MVHQREREDGDKRGINVWRKTYFRETYVRLESPEIKWSG